MPILYKYKDGSGYYVRGTPPGANKAIVTWQIKQEGVDLLRARGYKGESIPFPGHLLKELIDRDLAYTNRSGITLRPTINISYQRPSDIQHIPSHGAAALFFIESKPWHLEVRIPELPKQWLEKSTHLVQSLSNGWISIEDKAPIPAMRLWPGRGGIQIPVEPQHSLYKLYSTGEWPAEWNVSAWLGEIPGLETKITLFSGETQQRLLPGSLIELGKTYVLVAPTTFHLEQNHQLALEIEAIGHVGTWQAWLIQMPFASTPQLHDWCKLIGYRLAESRFKLDMVTPPLGYSGEGNPIVSVGKDIVFALSSLDDRSKDEDSIYFYKTRFPEAGTYGIEVEDKSHLAFYVEAQKNLHTVLPSWLAITIAWEHTGITFHSLQNGFGPHHFQLSHSFSAETTRITIDCPAHLNIYWEMNDISERRESLSVEDSGNVIISLLSKAVSLGENLRLQIDAGVYGRLALHITIPKVAKSCPGELSTTAVYRARWLATMLNNSSKREISVALSPSNQRALKRLAEISGCVTLSSARTAPVSLLPYIYALTKSIPD